MSPIATHLLVACATQQPAVRLVDLRSGAATHSLAGHTGAILTTAWSPVAEHLVASGGTDGAVRFWDIRRSAGCLGVLDKEDSVGVVGDGFGGSGVRNRQQGRAHAGAVNGIVWTEDGRHLVSTGHDERVRVWDTTTGANTLASFGPAVKNAHLSALVPLVSPAALTAPGRELLFYPSEREILVYELFEGRMLKRLKTPHRSTGTVGAAGGGGQQLKNRTTALSWRAHDVELYSAHADGTIRAWAPRTEEDIMVDDEEREEAEHEEQTRKRKREALEDIYRDFTKRQMAFT